MIIDGMYPRDNLRFAVFTDTKATEQLGTTPTSPSILTISLGTIRQTQAQLSNSELSIVDTDVPVRLLVPDAFLHVAILHPFFFVLIPHKFTDQTVA